MATSKRSKAKSPQRMHDLRQQNRALRIQLRKANEDSEAYRKAYQALAIKQITPAQLKEWDQEVEDSGQTILDVLKEYTHGRESNGRV